MVEASFLPGLLLSLSPRAHVHPDHVCMYLYVQRIWYAHSVHVASCQLGLRHDWDLGPIFNIVCRWESIQHGTLWSVHGNLGAGSAHFGGAPKFPTTLFTIDFLPRFNFANISPCRNVEVGTSTDLLRMCHRVAP